jgi:hypothetical protein
MDALNVWLDLALQPLKQPPTTGDEQDKDDDGLEVQLHIYSYEVLPNMPLTPTVQMLESPEKSAFVPSACAIRSARMTPAAISTRRFIT